MNKNDRYIAFLVVCVWLSLIAVSLILHEVFLGR